MNGSKLFSRFWRDGPSTNSNSGDVEYEMLLPADNQPPRHINRARSREIRPLWICLTLCFFFASGFFVHGWWSGGVNQSNHRSKDPPLYGQYRQRERMLSQHNSSHLDPETKFLWFANHGEDFGWGNYLQELLFNAYLAYASRRSFVFDDYTWRRTGPDVVEWYGHRIPARIPLSAIITGPLVGGESPNLNVPPAVSREYYLSVCPEDQRVILNTQSINAALGETPSASQIVQRWVTELDKINATCVELDEQSPALFSYNVTNTARILDILPRLSKSPILSDFGWSPLILSEFYTNLPHFDSYTEMDTISTTETSTKPLKGLLVIHIRRGDYGWWCKEAWKNRQAFTGVNSLPELLDKYPHPPNGRGPKEVFRKHCYPTIEEIVSKVLQVAKAKKDVKWVYIMSNAKRAWLRKLVAALEVAYEWHMVSTSRDLELSWEGKYVSQALDMYVGQRAELFIGNGFSSLTSNTVLLRRQNPELDPSDIHFW
ncbi:hypothetical protein MIND_00173100 [Mycena indigotica]|uniref:Uncharacterized protein n=1 Tax=Mycena indigotica TaxID=2126181 RepID=A0A8H6TF27_9AGAR|nr:uncharacterized protein MIND_00173100 [Mycena indigotica]KAF7316538.1 hypothetical protein MIND_00173100 [Mycena indigotica]